VSTAGQVFHKLPPDWKYIAHIGSLLHWVGFVLLLVDFFVSGVPVRLLHFIQPLGVALFYNIALVIFTAVTHRRGPFYHAADYFSPDRDVSRLTVLSSCCCTRKIASQKFGDITALSPVSIQTQSLALRALRLDGNRAERKRLRWKAANHGCHCFNRASYWLLRLAWFPSKRNVRNARNASDCV